MYFHSVGMGFFDLHGLILCGSEGLLSKLLYVHIEGIGTFDLHVLILCVSEGFLCGCMWIHNSCIETFVLHELILCVSAGLNYLLNCIHIANIDDSFQPYSIFAKQLKDGLF